MHALILRFKATGIQIRTSCLPTTVPVGMVIICNIFGHMHSHSQIQRSQVTQTCSSCLPCIFKFHLSGCTIEKQTCKLVRHIHSHSQIQRPQVTQTRSSCLPCIFKFHLSGCTIEKQTCKLIGHMHSHSQIHRPQVTQTRSSCLPYLNITCPDSYIL